MFVIKLLIFLFLFTNYEWEIFAMDSELLNDHATDVIPDTTELNLYNNNLLISDQDDDIQSLFEKYEKKFITNETISNESKIDVKFYEDNVTDSVLTSTDHVIASVQDIIGKFQANVENDAVFPIEVLNDTNTDYIDLAVVHHEELSYGHPDYVEKIQPKQKDLITSNIYSSTKKIEPKTLEKTEINRTITQDNDKIETTTTVEYVKPINDGTTVMENNSTSIRPSIFSNMATIIRNAIGTLIKRTNSGRNLKNQNFNDEDDLMMSDATTVETLINIETDQLDTDESDVLWTYKEIDNETIDINASEQNKTNLELTTVKNVVANNNKLQNIATTEDFEATTTENSIISKNKKKYYELENYHPTTTIKTDEEIIYNETKYEENKIITEILKEIEEKILDDVFIENPEEKINNGQFVDQSLKVDSLFDYIIPKENENYEMGTFYPTTAQYIEKGVNEYQESQNVTEEYRDIITVLDKSQENHFETNLFEDLATKINSSFNVIIPKEEKPIQTTQTLESTENVSYIKPQIVNHQEKEIINLIAEVPVTHDTDKENKFVAEIPEKSHEKINNHIEKNLFEDLITKINASLNINLPKEEKNFEEKPIQSTQKPESPENVNNIKPELEKNSNYSEKKIIIKDNYQTVEVPYNLEKKINHDTNKDNKLFTEVPEKSQEKIDTNIEKNIFEDLITKINSSLNINLPKEEETFEEKPIHPTQNVASTENVNNIKPQIEKNPNYSEMEIINKIHQVPVEIQGKATHEVPEKSHEKIDHIEKNLFEVLVTKINSSLNIPKEEKIFEEKTILESTENVNYKLAEVPDNLQEKVNHAAEKHVKNETFEMNSLFGITVPEDKLHLEMQTIKESKGNDCNSKPELKNIQSVGEKQQEIIQEVIEIRNNHPTLEIFSSPVIIRKDENTENVQIVDNFSSTKNEDAETIYHKNSTTVPTTAAPILFTLLPEDHFEEKIISNNDFIPKENLNMEIHVISEENYQVPEIRENKNNVSVVETFNKTETNNQGHKVDNYHLNLFDIISGKNAIHDDSSTSISEESHTEIYAHSTEYYNKINHQQIITTTEKLPLTSSSSSSSSESVSTENANDRDDFILQRVNVKGVSIWELSAKPIVETYDDAKSKLQINLNKDYNTEVDKSLSNVIVLAEKSYRDARTLGQIQESDFIEERDIMPVVETDSQRSETLHTITKKDSVDEVKLDNFEDIGKLINLENADVIDEIIYKSIAKESEHQLISDQIHEVTETTILLTEADLTTVETEGNNINYINNNGTVEEIDEPVTTKDVFKAIVDAVELSSDVTKTIENFHDVMDKNSATLEANNQIVSSKKTREMFEFGVDNFIAQEIMNNTNNDNNDNNFIEIIAIGLGALIALSAVLTLLVIAIQKARAYNILDFAPV